jgi:hypothetical protein
MMTRRPSQGRRHGTAHPHVARRAWRMRLVARSLEIRPEAPGKSFASTSGNFAQAPSFTAPATPA